jgi:TRAP-type C4-dicarboxylate transport system substrate-binding protein
MMSKITYITGLALAASVAGVSGAFAAPLELKLAHYLPTGNGLHSEFMEPWARELETCSQGAVKVEIFPAGTQLGNPAKLYDAVRAGAVDIAFGLTGLPGGRFERTRIAELPFLFDSSDEASHAMWSIFPEHLEQEFPGVKILALNASNPGQIHTTSATVRTPADLNGLRLRMPTEGVGAMLMALGANPVGLPPGEVYENAEKGVIDGAVFTWDTMESFKLAEVMKHHLDAKAYVATFWFGMNEKTYNGLPDAVKACVDQASGDVLEAKFGDWWNAWDQGGHDLVSGEGHEIITLSDAERAQWASDLQPMIETYLDGLEAKGIDDAKEIYAALKAYAAAH